MTKPSSATQVVDFLLRFVPDALPKPFDSAAKALLETCGDPRLHRQLIEAARHAESNFRTIAREELARDELIQAVASLPVFDNQVFQQSLKDLPHHLDEDFLAKDLQRAISDDWKGKFDAAELRAGVAIYLNCLRVELLKVEGYANLIVGLATLRTDMRTAEIDKGVKELLRRSSPSENLIRAGPGPLPRQIVHNLPQPDYVEFIGREDKLGEILSILLPDSCESLVSIEGEGGAGKSSLALQVCRKAHEASTEKGGIKTAFDFIVWTSARPALLQAASIVPRLFREKTIFDIYKTIAITANRPDILNSSKEDQHRRMRLLLAEFRFLIVIDNFESVSDQGVFQFLSEIPFPSKIIITTRKAAFSGHTVKLRGLTLDQSCRLVDIESARRKVTSPDWFAQELWRLTEGLPIAIVWSVARLVSYEARQVVADISDSKGYIAQFCFDTLRQEIIGKPADNLLLALSMFPNSASPATLGYVCGLHQGLSDGVSRLLALSLIYRKDHRLAMPSLTRQFSLDHLKSNDALLDTFQRRVLEWANRLFQGNRDWEFNFASYETVLEELENLEAAVGMLTSTNELEKSEDLIVNVAHVLHVIGRWDDMNALVDYMVERGTDPKLSRLVIKLHILQGRHLAHRGDGTAALKVLKGAEEVARAIGEKKELAEAMMRCGQALNVMGRYEEAIEKLEQSCALSDELKYPRVRVSAEGYIGDVYISCGKPESAIAPLSHAAKTAADMGWDRAHGYHSCLLGRAYLALGEFGKADDCFQDAFRVIKRWTDARLHGWTLLGLAETSLARGQRQESYDYAIAASNVFLNSNMKRDFDRAMDVIAKLNDQ